MKIGEIMDYLDQECSVARLGWNGTGMFIVLMPPLQLPAFNTQDTNRKVNDRTAKWIGENTPLDCQPYFALFTADKKWQPGFNFSTADMLADDWYVVRYSETACDLFTDEKFSEWFSKLERENIAAGFPYPGSVSQNLAYDEMYVDYQEGTLPTDCINAAVWTNKVAEDEEKD